MTDRDLGARLLIVDDDPIIAESMAQFLRDEGHDAEWCNDAESALDRLARAREQADPGRGKPCPFKAVISDVSMPRKSGLDLLREIQDRFPETVVIMLTGYGTIESAVEALRLGAADYLSKPVVDAELRMALQRAMRQQQIVQENSNLRAQLDTRYGLGNILGSDYRMAKALELIDAVAPSKATVLMLGESGTGKSTIARSIHRLSPRNSGPFVELHCGAVPEALLESELFGHVQGAFTGAHADKQGRFLAADGGTIFLDEINSASPAMQMKLLRVLQERCFEPVGSNQTIQVDTRVILASNQPLEPLVESGAFRQDLYYRINVVTIELPPLRDRAADIPALADHFLERYAQEHARPAARISDEALEALVKYRYPGNVRELENLIERAVVLSRHATIGVDDLPDHVRSPAAASHSLAGAVDAPGTEWTPIPLTDALREPEKRIILKALEANDWNRQVTAEQLGINRTTLYKKMKLLGIDRLAG